ncbi:MAG: hypothetical protein MI810_10040 [Flavobacteriales bacterium]|nr:hypothetical protein [Flavobacteriales bacterium]
MDEVAIHEVFGLDAKLIEDDLEEEDFHTKSILYSVLGLHPASPDSLKAPGIQYLDECIAGLSELRRRNKKIKSIGFKLIDGFFITEEDDFIYHEDPAAYIKESRSININRFIGRYQQTIEQIFGSINLYVCGMKWRRIVPPGEEIER